MRQISMGKNIWLSICILLSQDFHVMETTKHKHLLVTIA